MGHQQSRGNQSQKDLEHSIFGKVHFPKKKSDKQPQTMQVELPCDQISYKNWKQNLKSKQSSFPNIKFLLIPSNHKFSSGGLCSQSGISKITYEKLPYVLEDQIQSVRNKKINFSEPELWRLLYVIVSAKNQYLDLMKDTSLNLGNINPKNIFLNEKNTIKLSNTLSWPHFIDGYRNALMKESSYLSPQDIKSLELGASNNDANINSQQFSIGMTLLSAGLTENLEKLYNFEYHGFNFVEFQQKLILWKTTLYYSQILRSVILSLLQTDPSKRLTLREISEFLRPHIANILAQKPLLINNTNTKIDAEIQSLRKQLPGLLRYRFEKYSPQKARQINQRSLPKQSRKNSPPKNIIKSPQGVQNNYPSLYSPNSMEQQTGQTIARVKSQTKFTYSNKPLEGVTPVKFVLQNNNQPTIVQYQSVQSFAPPSSVFLQQNILSPRDKSNTSNLRQQPHNSPQVLNSANQRQEITTVRPAAKKIGDIVDEIFPPNIQKRNQSQQNSAQIARRLTEQGLIHADSEIQVQTPNKQKSQPQTNQIENKDPYNINKEIFDRKEQESYNVYADILIKCDFNEAWIELIAMIHRPDLYFPQLENRILVSDSLIQIPPGRVKLAANKEEGKIHLQNVSQTCSGEILGGVSKYSPTEVQVWFNSSYSYKGKAYPSSDYFRKSLELLKEKLQ